MGEIKMSDVGILGLFILGFATLIVGANWFAIRTIKKYLNPLLSIIDG
jgi:hypothetical protein